MAGENNEETKIKIRRTRVIKDITVIEAQDREE